MFEKGNRVTKNGSNVKGTVVGICEETIHIYDKDKRITGEAQSRGDIKVRWDGSSEGQYEAVTTRLLTKI
jgi:hypothetical protein